MRTATRTWAAQDAAPLWGVALMWVSAGGGPQHVRRIICCREEGPVANLIGWCLVSLEAGHLPQIEQSPDGGITLQCSEASDPGGN